MQKKEDALKGVKLFVLDMDGTVYLGNHMIDGALDFIHEVDASEDRDYIFFTNNASRVPSVYVEKLHKLGLDVDESKVVTAVPLFLKKTGKKKEFILWKKILM